MKKIDPDRACPVCHVMGDHAKDCPNYPKEWQDHTHEIDLEKDPSGCCLICGCPVC